MPLLKVICSSAEFDKKVWCEDTADFVCSVLLLAPGKSGYRQYYATVKSAEAEKEKLRDCGSNLLSQRVTNSIIISCISLIIGILSL